MRDDAMTIQPGDVIRLHGENYNFSVAEVWGDNEVLLVGGRIASISDVVGLSYGT